MGVGQPINQSLQQLFLNLGLSLNKMEAIVLPEHPQSLCAFPS